MSGCANSCPNQTRITTNEIIGVHFTLINTILVLFHIDIWQIVKWFEIKTIPYQCVCRCASSYQISDGISFHNTDRDTAWCHCGSVDGWIGQRISWSSFHTVYRWNSSPEYVQLYVDSDWLHDQMSWNRCHRHKDDHHCGICEHALPNHEECWTISCM